ncbi:MAG: phosphoribosylamine--glycine ligase [Rhodospirillales bacterium]|nr:MAG: phosphoribosylamine--glycine ligase [Rhodospirillales bacterium]
MKVLVVGSGGREHALCWAIAHSPLCTALFCAPGNAGIAAVATCLPVAADDVEGIVAAAHGYAIDFAVIGPEAPLVAGVVDRLEEAGIATFGPRQEAAAIEGSKAFMKELCARFDIPSAAFARFDEPEAAKSYIHRKGAPIVVKADGLAAGKGVMVCRTENEAHAAVDHILIEGAFGAAGSEVVIEEFLEGEEASFFALVHHGQVLPLASAQDHKPAFDGDEGPNTGGMGAYSPAPVVTPAIADQVMSTIIRPAVAAMAEVGRPYTGLLYAGLMITADGPKLLEFNARFGDPECQPLLVRLKSDLLEALIACRDGRLDQISLHWHDDAALTVVMATRGYPGYYPRGSVIRGVDRAEAVPGVAVFHAGTTRKDGHLVADGGRVLGVTARGPTVAEAQATAYRAVDLIDWPEGFCRRDIGWRAIRR